MPTHWTRQFSQPGTNAHSTPCHNLEQPSVHHSQLQPPASLQVARKWKWGIPEWEFKLKSLPIGVIVLQTLITKIWANIIDPSAIWTPRLAHSEGNSYGGPLLSLQEFCFHSSHLINPTPFILAFHWPVNFILQNSKTRTSKEVDSELVASIATLDGTAHHLDLQYWELKHTTQ